MKKISSKSKKRIQKITIAAISILMIAAVVMLIVSTRTRQKENTIFSVNKIIIYNSAGIENNGSNQSLTDLTINQFSDLSIFINNSSENSSLTASNTIKDLYIDNISISTLADSNTEKVLNYKNSLSLGKYSNLEKAEDDRIDFEIVKNNLNNSSSQYKSPTFYTDCSNPITLGYINKNVINNYSISSKKNTVSFNSKVLKNTSMNLDDISTTIKFTIHIVNNAGHKLSCNMKVDITFDDDFVNNGYSYISIPLSGNEYKFKRN